MQQIGASGIAILWTRENRGHTPCYEYRVAYIPCFDCILKNADYPNSECPRINRETTLRLFMKAPTFTNVEDALRKAHELSRSTDCPIIIINQPDIFFPASEAKIAARTRLKRRARANAHFKRRAATSAA